MFNNKLMFCVWGGNIGVGVGGGDLGNNNHNINI